MTEQNVTETAQIVNETEINEVENPANATLSLNDAYMDSIYKNTLNGAKHILTNVALNNPDGTSVTLGKLLGQANVDAIAGFINNDVILPLIYALGDLHGTANTLMSTTFQTVQKDMCLHKVSDVFLLQQSILQLGISTNVYYNRAAFDDKFPESDGWSFNLLELNAMIVQAEEEAGITYKDDEVPYRNEYVELLDIKGNHMPNCRFVNFTYTNTATNTQEVTDIPAFWNDDINEYVFIPYILKWRKANKLPASLDDANFDSSAISGAFLARTTEAHEQVHQQRVAERQAALEAQEAERKKTESIADAVENNSLADAVNGELRNQVNDMAKESKLQEALDAHQSASSDTASDSTITAD